MRSEVRGGEEGKSPNVSPHTELMVGAGSANIKGKAEIETRKADIISKSVCGGYRGRRSGIFTWGPAVTNLPYQ